MTTVIEPRAAYQFHESQGPHSYRFDIRLRGEGETPFFDD